MVKNNTTMYCSVWNADDAQLEEGPHGEVDTVILTDAYSNAGQLSQHLPGDQYVGERDMEGVGFRIDISGDEITADDVSSAPGTSNSYLNKFPGIYEAVAKYVADLDFAEEDFKCGHTNCTNFAILEESIDVFSDEE